MNDKQANRQLKTENKTQTQNMQKETDIFLMDGLCWFCNDSWCNCQIVDLVYLTHFEPIYRCSPPH